MLIPLLQKCRSCFQRPRQLSRPIMVPALLTEVSSYNCQFNYPLNDAKTRNGLSSHLSSTAPKISHSADSSQDTLCSCFVFYKTEEACT